MQTAEAETNILQVFVFNLYDHFTTNFNSTQYHNGVENLNSKTLLNFL